MNLRRAILLTAVLMVSSELMAQDRIVSGPYKGFLQEHPGLNTVEIAKPFIVSVVKGTVLYSTDRRLAGAAFEIRDKRGRVRTAITDENGGFVITEVPRGTYDFKVTKDEFQPVVGRVIVLNRYSLRKRRPIRVVVQLGT